MKINRSAYDTGSTNWVTGTTDDGYWFEAEVHAEPSENGIKSERFEQGGNVTELHIRDARGRDMYSSGGGLCYGESVRHYAEAAREIVDALETEFCEVV